MVMLDAICDCLQQLNVDYIRIDGTTKNDIRTVSGICVRSSEAHFFFKKHFPFQMHVKRFQENSSCLAAVLSIKACNSGITLTAAQLVIFAELDWNPSVSKTLNLTQRIHTAKSKPQIGTDSSPSRKPCSSNRSGRFRTVSLSDGKGNCR